MEKKNYAAVVAFLQDGFGPDVSIALMDCVERYLPSFIKEGSVPCDKILDCHWMLCALLKAVVKDEYGIDLEGNSAQTLSEGNGNEDQEGGEV